MRNNGSLYLHTYIIKKEDKSSQKNVKERLSDVGVAYSSKQLNKFKKLRYTKTQNLLTGESPLTPEEMEVLYI